MIFVPKEKAQECCRRLREERLERLKKSSLERRQAYSKNKQKN